MQRTVIAKGQFHAHRRLGDGDTHAEALGENRVAGLVLVVPALWLAWWLGSPLFIDDVANEEFPLTANATVPENVTRAEAESMMEIAAKLESTSEEPMTSGWGRLRRSA